MDALVSYLFQNWATILVLIAFAIVLLITVFLDKHSKIRMYITIAAVFVFSIVVFVEFYLEDLNILPNVRIIFMAIRYSFTPLIIALILYALVKESRWFVIIPALLFAVVNVVSIFTGIVFSLDEDGHLVRGVLGYLPYIGVGLYSAALVITLLYQSNRQVDEIIPIAFLAFSFLSGLVFPFIFKQDYSKIFVVSIAISLFVYYVFQILQLTKKDALTGLLNRQAYYANVRDNAKDISAMISIDMNGLKTINDTGGHHAGDIALETLAICFFKSAKGKQSVYRLGGDEFMIVCKRTSKEELDALIKRIKDSVSKTKYTCSIGYSFNDSNKTVEQMVKESDEMMYQDKEEYYRLNNLKRRHQ